MADSNSGHIDDLLEKHKAVFGSDLGTAKGFKAKIVVNRMPPHGFSEHCSVPYFYRNTVENGTVGLLTYYSKFLPNMANVLAPLYALLGKDVKWMWSDKEHQAFESSKTLLTTDTLFVHFTNLLMCDASSYGIGAVLAHRMPDGTERPCFSIIIKS